MLAQAAIAHALVLKAASTIPNPWAKMAALTLKHSYKDKNFTQIFSRFLILIHCICACIFSCVGDGLIWGIDLETLELKAGIFRLKLKNHPLQLRTVTDSNPLWGMHRQVYISPTDQEVTCFFWTEDTDPKHPRTTEF